MNMTFPFFQLHITFELINRVLVLFGRCLRYLTKFEANKFPFHILEPKSRVGAIIYIETNCVMNIHHCRNRICHSAWLCNSCTMNFI